MRCDAEDDTNHGMRSSAEDGTDHGMRCDAANRASHATRRQHPTNTHSTDDVDKAMRKKRCDKLAKRKSKEVANVLPLDRKETPMNVVAWIVLGGAAGWIASIIMNVEGNLPRDIIVGIVGALIGGCIMSLVSSQDFGEFNLWSILAALICSIALLGALDYAIQHGIRR